MAKSQMDVLDSPAWGPHTAIMPEKPSIDAAGAVMLVAMSLLFAFNQVVIKVTNGGLQPVFGAGLRSLGAVFCVALYMWLRSFRFDFSLRMLPWGLLIGALFAAEFTLMFVALDFTTVARSAVFLYTMPMWLALAGHFLLPGERLTPLKSMGLALAFSGVVLALSGERDAQDASVIGDLMAIGAGITWAGIALVARATPLREMRAEMQLFYQVLVSAPLLFLAAPFFGPLIRDLAPIHLWGLAFQVVVVVSLGFVIWLWLLGRYPAAEVASFAFLGPVFGVLLGWFLLSEPVGASVLGALALVALGLVLITRPASRRPEPTIRSRSAEGR